jgi:hypothetical protein
MKILTTFFLNYKDLTNETYPEKILFEFIYPIKVKEMWFLRNNYKFSTMVEFGLENFTGTYYEMLTYLKNQEMDCINFVAEVKSILKNGKLLKNPNEYNNDFSQFLNSFVYMSFFTEVQRHPAAAVYNVMALDILDKWQGAGNNDDCYEWITIKSPMSGKGTVVVVSKIQEMLKNELVSKNEAKKYIIPYTFRHNRVQTFLSSEIVSNVNEFLKKERALFSKWKEFYDAGGNIAKLKEVCSEYYCGAIFS